MNWTKRHKRVQNILHGTRATSERETNGLGSYRDLKRVIRGVPDAHWLVYEDVRGNTNRAAGRFAEGL